MANSRRVNSRCSGRTTCQARSRGHTPRSCADAAAPIPAPAPALVSTPWPRFPRPAPDSAPNPHPCARSNPPISENRENRLPSQRNLTNGRTSCKLPPHSLMLLSLHSLQRTPNALLLVLFMLLLQVPVLLTPVLKTVRKYCPINAPPAPAPAPATFNLHPHSSMLLPHFPPPPPRFHSAAAAAADAVAHTFFENSEKISSNQRTAPSLPPPPLVSSPLTPMLLPLPSLLSPIPFPPPRVKPNQPISFCCCRNRRCCSHPF